MLSPIEPFPSPNIHDEFNYLLASDTFAHGRLTNPTPPVWHHFEQFYVVMQPPFALKYGVAQPLFMAMGQRLAIFKSPGRHIAEYGAGRSQFVLDAPSLSTRGMGLARRTAGGGSHQLVQLFRQCHWGGSVAILGGRPLLGAAARLGRRSRARDGLLMALGLLLLANGARLKAPSSHCPFASIPCGFFFASARVFAPGCRASLCCWQGLS